ncbi:Fis family sigma-54 specific transcriptional regulator [Flavobacterium beibuense]|uniref:Fis family sigma-54 specific transcriptional regulator n=2 Tax=Flavobacterium beibuense TaxID=657326 RepID=A0A444WEK2_9FLAO|nr:Fis family sigma-54 specific transcriptional regulator [Flavobacterium beibuense]
MLEKAGYTVCGLARSVPEALVLIAREKPELALVDIQLSGDSSGIELAQVLNERNIAFIYVSANSNHEVLMQAKATQPYGFIVKPFREKDLLVTLEIALYRHENGLETAVKKEEQLRLGLLSVIQTKDSVQEKMLSIAKALQAFLSFDYLVACTTSATVPTNFMSYLRIGFDEYQYIGMPEFEVITRRTREEIANLEPTHTHDEPRSFFVGEAFEQMLVKHPVRRLIAETFSLASMFLLPMTLSDGSCYYFTFFSRKEDAYSSAQITLLERLSNPLRAAMQDMMETDQQSHHNLDTAAQLAKQKKNEPRLAAAHFEGIIGRSHLLLNVFDNVTHVAPVDTSVLILGESGTGKERLAHCVHELSPRRSQPFVRVNCAALPFNLIESELFGHEKGAFTGAVERRIGKFEKADKGTIFLDEIGEMPPELQAKLLRVLQEKEIDRIGGNDPVKIDVRVVAATNRDLEKEVAAGRFRLDLFYRLNIFPVTLPPLRERRDDIPLLISHFITIYNHKADKAVKGISKKGLNEALNYHWPGNIRELENLVERAVLVCGGDELNRLEIPNYDNHGFIVTEEGGAFKSIDENERDHILEALRKCRGKVWGPDGAAELLGLPPTTLHSKMKRFGIRRNTGS